MQVTISPLQIHSRPFTPPLTPPPGAGHLLQHRVHEVSQARGLLHRPRGQVGGEGGFCYRLMVNGLGICYSVVFGFVNRLKLVVSKRLEVGKQG